MRTPTQEHTHSAYVRKLIADDLASVHRAMLRLDADVATLTEHVHALLGPAEDSVRWSDDG